MLFASRLRRRHRSVTASIADRLYIESLERRDLLAAAPLNQAGLFVDVDHFDPSSILVRLDDAYAQMDDMPAVQAMRSFTHIDDLYEVRLSTGYSVLSALDAFREHPAVLYAEPNYRISIAAQPDDPQFADLWGLNNTGQTGGTADADIDAAEAWDTHTGSGSTIVAVIDTGVDYNHPDLASNMWVNDAELNGAPNVDDDNNGFVDDVHGYDFFNNDGDPLDDHNHGTHVAGTIGAAGNNAVGVVGINWDVQIMAVKFLDGGGNGNLGDAISAIDYAVDNGATISNNSWGFNGGFSQALHDAIEDAGAQDHIFVAATGNGNAFGIGQNNDGNPFWPASFDLDNIVSVAATDHDDVRATFSNFGATSVDLAAPGVGILSTTRNDTYSTFNGTSMATPHVAGAIALAHDLHPTWTTEQLIAQVNNSVDPIAAMEGITVTGGRLNAAAMLVPDTTGPAVVDISPDNGYGNLTRLRLTFSEQIDEESFTVGDIQSFTGPNGTITVTDVQLVANSGQRQFELTFSEQTTLGTYSLTVGPNVTDLFANAMDQDGDGITGEVSDDQYSVDVEILPPATGYVGYWKLDDGSGSVATDSAPGGSDGTLSPGMETTSWVTDAAPIAEANPHALRFDGSGDHVTIPSGGDLDITASAVSLSLWVKLDVLPSELVAANFAGIYDSAEDSYVLYEDPLTDELRFKVTDADGSAERPGIATSQLQTDQWYHIAGVYDGETGTASIYLDGQLVDSHVSNFLTGPVQAGQVAALGRDGENDRYYFSGQIDEVRVFDRALGEHEIAVLSARLPGIRVLAEANLTTTEAGDTASFEIVLDSPPSDDVTIALSSSDASEGTVSPTNVTFTNANWHQPQTVTATGVDDVDEDGDVAYTTVTAAAVSNDPDYSGLDAADVQFTNLDDDALPAAIAHWALDDGSGSVATDSSPNGNDATLGGGLDATGWTTDTAPVAAENSHALQFDGVNDHVALPSGGVFDIGTNAVSLSLWVKMDELPDGLVGKSYAGIYDSSNDAYVLYEDAITDELRFKVTDADGTAERPGIKAADLEVDRWHHVVGVYDGSAGTASIYLDGVHMDTHNNGGLTGDVRNGQVAALGRNGTLGQNYFQGSIDDVRVFAHALSTTEIDELASRAAGITVTAAANLTSTEAGGTATFDVVLESAPTDDVTIALSSSDTSEGTVAPASVTFTDTNWNQAQTVTVTGVDDAIEDGDIAYSIVTATAVSNDPAYSGLDAADVSITNLDDDALPSAVAHWKLDEGNGIVAIDSVGSNDGTLGGGIDADGWVTATAPTPEANSHALRFDGSDDHVSLPGGGALDINANAVSLSLWVKLEELPDGLVGQSFAGIYDSSNDAYVLYEDGFADELRFKVTDADGTAERPGIKAADLVLNQWHHVVGVYDGTAGTASIYLDGALMDIHTNGNLTGNVKSGQVAALGRNGTFSQYYFQGSIDDVRVFAHALSTSEIDDLRSSSPGITIIAAPELTTTESGGTATFSVVLDSPPTDDVTINLSSSDTSEGTVNPTSVLFTNANWNQSQTVTITGVDDAIIDGDVAYTILTAAAISNDPGYSGLDATDVQVTNLDDDALASAIANWKLDDGSGTLASDSSSNGNDGTLNGGLSATGWTTDVAPTPTTNTHALQFDGTNDYVSLPSGGVLNIAANAVTLSLWVKLAELPDGLVGQSFAGIYDSSQDAYVLYEDGFSDELRFKVTDADGTAERPGIAASDLQLDHWHHVVGVYDGTVGTAAIYLDGVLKDTHNNGNLTGNVKTGQVASLGRDGSLNQYYFHGSIDDVQVFDRALSDAEITAIGGQHIASIQDTIQPIPVDVDIDDASRRLHRVRDFAASIVRHNITLAAVDEALADGRLAARQLHMPHAKYESIHTEYDEHRSFTTNLVDLALETWRL